MEKELESLKLLIESIKELNITAALLIAAVIIIIAILQAMFGSYLKKKFQYIATTENFEQLKVQLSDNTKAVEEVKASIQSEVWLSQQIWTKKHESYEKIIVSIFIIKGLLKERLNKNSQWLKDINKTSVDYDLDEKFKELIDFSNCKETPTFLSNLELQEEAIIAKSVFLTPEFQSIEREIKKIKLLFSSFENTIEEKEVYEKTIERLSNILESKVEALESVIDKIKLISSKDLTLKASTN